MTGMGRPKRKGAGAMAADELHGIWPPKPREINSLLNEIDRLREENAATIERCAQTVREWPYVVENRALLIAAIRAKKVKS